VKNTSFTFTFAFDTEGLGLSVRHRAVCYDLEANRWEKQLLQITNPNTNTNPDPNPYSDFRYGELFSTRSAPGDSTVS